MSKAKAPTKKLRKPAKQRRGFRAMSPEKQREIAAKGGKAVSKNKKHMAAIGRKGGSNSHKAKKSAKKKVW